MNCISLLRAKKKIWTAPAFLVNRSLIIIFPIFTDRRSFQLCLSVFHTCTMQLEDNKTRLRHFSIDNRNLENIHWTTLLSVRPVQCFFFMKFHKFYYIILFCRLVDWFPLNFQVVKNDILILNSGCDLASLTFDGYHEQFQFGWISPRAFRLF